MDLGVGDEYVVGCRVEVWSAVPSAMRCSSPPWLLASSEWSKGTGPGFMVVIPLVAASILGLVIGFWTYGPVGLSHLRG